MNFQSTPRPTSSPWGVIQSAEQIAPGIWHVSTPSHGGFLISQERFTAMPLHLRQFQTFNGHTLAYEEDCDWGIVVEAFPDCFDQATRDAASVTYIDWIAPKHRRVDAAPAIVQCLLTYSNDPYAFHGRI